MFRFRMRPPIIDRVTRLRRLRRALKPAIAAGVAGTLAMLVPPPGSAGAAGPTLQHSAKHTLVRGVQWWSVSWTNHEGYQHAYVMSIDLTHRRLHIQAGMANGNVNDRQTIAATAGRLQAVGGINGDLFSWSTYLPWGGVGIGGTVFKSPARDRPSQFYIRTDGKAGIGPLDFGGTVRQINSGGTLGTQHFLSAVNTPGSANTGNLTLFTPAVVTSLHLERCAAVSGPIRDRVMTVRHVFPQVREFGPLRTGTRLLAGCAKSGEWLMSNAHLGQRLRITQHLTTPAGKPVATFLSGQRTLRQNGRIFHDTTGFHTIGINPETAACVSKDRSHVLFVAVDGWIGSSGGGNGVTLPELERLTAALHCWSSVVFDGGGSTTMVARRAGVERVINQMPQLFGQRPVPNGLFVIKR
jgi:Phosphodiester glycosidase